MTTTDVLAASIVARLDERGETLASAESLTGGLVCARIVDAPGASSVVRGGVVAYDVAIKSELLGVDTELLSARGAVEAGVAQQMAEGVRRRLGATWGISTTGVAGPEPAEGKPVGTVFISVAGPGGTSVRELALSGDRLEIRNETTVEVLSLLLATLEEQSTDSDA